MSIASAMAPIEAINKEIVMQDTWGHLAPIKNKTYSGHFTYASSCFGANNPIMLSFEFKDLDSSPWLYNALQDLLYSLKTEPGIVYKFEGTIRNYKFKGDISQLLDTNNP